MSGGFLGPADGEEAAAATAALDSSITAESRGHGKMARRKRKVKTGACVEEEVAEKCEGAIGAAACLDPNAATSTFPIAGDNADGTSLTIPLQSSRGAPCATVLAAATAAAAAAAAAHKPAEPPILQGKQPTRSGSSTSISKSSTPGSGGGGGAGGAGGSSGGSSTSISKTSTPGSGGGGSSSSCNNGMMVGAPDASPSTGAATAGKAGRGATGAAGGTSRSKGRIYNESASETGEGPRQKRPPGVGKDWGGQPSSQAVKDNLLREATSWSVSEDGTWLGEDGNHFFCSACGESGDITCCDECPRVFHHDCLPLGSDSQRAAEHQTEHDRWYCPYCTTAGNTNLIAGKLPSWNPEDRAPIKKREKNTRLKEAKSKPSPAKTGKSCERLQGSSSSTSTPTRANLKASGTISKRATGTAALPAEEASGRPKAVSQPRSTAGGARGSGAGAGAKGLTTRTCLQEGGVACDGDGRKEKQPFTRQRLGALTGHLPLSPLAGQRPLRFTQDSLEAEGDGDGARGGWARVQRRAGRRANGGGMNDLVEAAERVRLEEGGEDGPRWQHRINGSDGGRVNSRMIALIAAVARAQPANDGDCGAREQDDVNGSGGDSFGSRSPRLGARRSAAAVYSENERQRRRLRRQNLANMLATNESSRERCLRCRSCPRGGAMRCTAPTPVKGHLFCLECIEAREGIRRTDLTRGLTEWECPKCRSGDARPSRVSRRIAAKAKGTTPLQASEVPVSATARGRGAQAHPASSPAAIEPISSRSVGTGVRARGSVRFRHAENPRGAGNGSGGSGGGPDVETKQVAPSEQTNDERRPMRMAATFALDRLQQLDPHGLFKDPVPPEVAGYAEAIEFPVDFSTIRRRSQRGVYESIEDLAQDVRLMCTNAKEFNAPDTIYQETARNVQRGAERIWPQAQKLLDGLLSAEATAAQHHIRGPTASADARPLDGPFVSLELTPANEDAYFMHIAIRRAAAAARARADQEEKEQEEELARIRKGKAGRAEEEARAEAASTKEERIASAVAAAVAVASSPALLYTRGEMNDEESILRDSLSAYRSHLREEALRGSAGSAKCDPILVGAWHERKRWMEPLARPVTRCFVPPDGEFLAHEAAGDQPVPSGLNPKLGRGKGEPLKAAVPEFLVVQVAHGTRQLSGQEAERHMLRFQGFFKQVAVVSKTRLRVKKSSVQGLGLFTTQAIPAYDLVTEYVGELVKLGEAQKRVARYRQAKNQDFIVRVGQDPVFLDATRKGNIARFLNHSCAPNLYMLTVGAGKDDNQEKRVCFFSLRDIAKGEELFYSYPAPHTVGLGVAVAPACACRAPGCRGRMSQREDQL